MVNIATQLMLGKELESLALKPVKIKHFGVKEAVFPFNMFHEVDPLLGPEMRSTGEVLGLSGSFGMAYYKAQAAVQTPLPVKGNVLISLTMANYDNDKVAALAKGFSALGFNILATEGTCNFLKANNISSEKILKLHEGRPNILDKITNGEIHLVINTPSGEQSKHDDSYIRKAAIKHKLPYITTIAAAMAAVKGIKAYIEEGKNDVVRALQEFHKNIDNA